MSKARDIADLNFDAPDIDGGTIDGATINATGLTVDTDTLYVDSTNNRVGIGTTSPARILHLKEAVPCVRFEDTDVSGVYHDILSEQNKGFCIRVDEGNVASGSYFRVDIDNSEKMRIGDDGVLTVNNDIRMPWSSSKYLIGPVPKSSNAFLTSFDSLEINGADAVAGGQAMAGGSVIIRGGDGVTNSGTNSYAGSVTIAGGQHIGSGLGSGSGSVKIQTSGTTRMEVDGPSGNLLLGTDDDVVSDTSGSGLCYHASGNYLALSRDTTSSTAGMLYLNQTGVEGKSIGFRKDGTSVGSVYIYSNGVAYFTSSDRRLKDNIETITDGTDKLMAMNPVTHTWKADSEAPAVHGFIAQEMQDIVPEAVSGDPEGDEMMALDYGRITPVLVAALQDAHKKIAELEARLNELEGN